MLGSTIGSGRQEWTDDLAGLYLPEGIAVIQAEARANGDELDDAEALSVIHLYQAWEHGIQTYVLRAPEPASLRDVLVTCVADDDAGRIPREAAGEARELAKARHASSQSGALIQFPPRGA